MASHSWQTVDNGKLYIVVQAQSGVTSILPNLISHLCRPIFQAHSCSHISLQCALARGLLFINSSHVLPTSHMVYQPTNQRNLWSIAYISSSSMDIMGSQCDQLPAQLLEQCTGIAEVMGLNPFKPDIFFRIYM